MMEVNSEYFTDERIDRLMAEAVGHEEYEDFPGMGKMIIEQYDRQAETYRKRIRNCVGRTTRSDGLTETVRHVLRQSTDQIPVYDFYCKLMEAQGIEPVSEEEFKEVSRINYGTSARRHRPYRYSRSLDRLERSLESESIWGNVESLRRQRFKRGDKVMLLGTQIPTVQEVIGYNERGCLIFTDGGTGRAQRYRPVSESEQQSIIKRRLEIIRQKGIHAGGYIVHSQDTRGRAGKVSAINEEGFLLLEDGKRGEPEFYLRAEFKMEGKRRRLKVFGEQRPHRSGRQYRR